jgi:hypothetical protein
VLRVSWCLRLTLVRRGAAPPVVAPGEVVELAATGNFMKDALVLLDCEEEEVLSEQLTEGRWEARVRVLPHALPRTCTLTALQPVSALRTSEEAFRVGGHYLWELQLSNGWKARFETTSSRREDLKGTATWSHASGVLGSHPVVLERSTTGFVTSSPMTAEEQRAHNEQAQA